MMYKELLIFLIVGTTIMSAPHNNNSTIADKHYQIIDDTNIVDNSNQMVGSTYTDTTASYVQNIEKDESNELETEYETEYETDDPHNENDYKDDDVSLEEAYKYNYDSYYSEDDCKELIGYDVPIDSCPGHFYETDNVWGDDGWVIAYYCPACGDYYEVPIEVAEENDTYITETEFKSEDHIEIENDIEAGDKYETEVLPTNDFVDDSDNIDASKDELLQSEVTECEISIEDETNTEIEE